MDPSIVRMMGALVAAVATSALAQTAPAPAAAPGAAPALPPQNYGAHPGFFRSAPEMAQFEQANGVVAVPPAASTPPAPTPPASTPVVAAPNGNVAVTVAAPPQRVPDPTQNLQWAERQMDREEATAAREASVAARTPPPVAPGAYNGQTDPATR
jgi:hypothetical protein